MTLSTCFI